MDEQTKYQLFKLIFDYVKNHKEVDEKFVDKIVEILVSSYKLHDYVRNIKISNVVQDLSGDIELASYSYPLKRIKFFLATFKELFYVSAYRFPFNDNDRIFYIYFSLLQILSHEFEHALQFKLLDTDFNQGNIEQLLLRSCYREYSAIKPNIVNELHKEGYSDSQIERYLKQKRQLYLDNYKFAPHERLAECKSHANVISIIELIKDSCPTLLTLEEYKLLRNYLRGYESGAIPTRDYLSAIGDSKTWFILQELGAGLDLKQRLLFGLDIDGDEYYQVSSYIENLSCMLL